ncbi:MAG: endolytic transglycosylase MltG [Bacteroidota bacterium]|nr:endolytic transglycosylase MltG [Bacteroidota bacterium]
MSKKVKSTKGKKILISMFIVLVITVLIAGYNFYNKIYLPNISFSNREQQYIYIPTGASFSDVVNLLNEKKMLKNAASFEWVAEQMNYKNQVKPGKYHIRKKMSNRDLVVLLRSGQQEPVKVTFNNIRTREQLASIVGVQLEADSSSIMGLLGNNAFLSKYGFNDTDCMALFIPNTYEFYWNTSAKQFIERMTKEYKKFWNESRRMKATNMGLNQTDVSVIASIVEQETQKNDEKPVIAGVYINRFKKGWKLEADPTLVYAAGDFTIQRVLNIHKEIDSPYNTYMNTGLPPGPICLPSIVTLDAVLNYTRHEYMFFCAKDDFSGYHSFAKSYSEHLINARRFQNELNRRKIRS